MIRIPTFPLADVFKFNCTPFVAPIEPIPAFDSVSDPVVVCAPVNVPLPNVNVKIDAAPLVPEVSADPVSVKAPFVPLIESPVPLIVSELTNCCVLRTAVPRFVSVVARVPIVVPSIRTIVVVSATAAVPVMLGQDKIRRVPETCEYAGAHISEAATKNKAMRFMVCLLNKGERDHFIDGERN